MEELSIKSAASCHWDCVSLGEVMLRLDPGEGRIHTVRQFQAWEGGGEYNVARGLRRCFGLRTGIVTALADNPIGRLVEDLILQGGVDPRYLRWGPYDGVRGAAPWPHTGGFFGALSPSTPEVAMEAMAAAREGGACVSYDLNYRESLWK